MTTAKVLIFDIETSPNLGDVWGLWNQNIGLAQLRESGHIMSFSAKWLGEEQVFYFENRKGNDKALCKKLIAFLDEADIVVGHNGKKFDIPWVQGRAAIHGIKPPSPFRVIDTLKISQKQFRFPSNKLEYLLEVFGCTKKLKHKKFPGHELWVECLAGNPEAWEEMKAYNIQDTVGLEELFYKLLPWCPNPPNLGVYQEGTETCCTACGSTKVHFRGYYYTNLSKFRRYQCQEDTCGKWGRLRTNELSKEVRANLGTNAL